MHWLLECSEESVCNLTSYLFAADSFEDANGVPLFDEGRELIMAGGG